MAALIEDPFDPDQFGNVFGEVLAKLADDGEVDCMTGPFLAGLARYEWDYPRDYY